LKFDCVITSDNVKNGKPNKEGVLKILSKLKIKRENTVYIGDSITDWEFAKNLNMAAIAIGDDDYDGQLFARFETVRESISELLCFPI